MLSGDDILATDEVLSVSDPAGGAVDCGSAGFGKQGAAYYPIRGGCVDGAAEHYLLCSSPVGAKSPDCELGKPVHMHLFAFAGVNAVLHICPQPSSRSEHDWYALYRHVVAQLPD